MNDKRFNETRRRHATNSRRRRISSYFQVDEGQLQWVRNKQNTNPIVCVCLFAARPLCWKKKKLLDFSFDLVMSRAQVNFCFALFMSFESSSALQVKVKSIIIEGLFWGVLSWFCSLVREFCFVLSKHFEKMYLKNIAFSAVSSLGSFFEKSIFFLSFRWLVEKSVDFFPQVFKKKYSVMRNFCFSQFIYWVFKHLLGSWFICVIQRTCKKYYSKKILFLFCMDVIQYITILIDAQHSVFVFINCIVLCEFNGLLWSLGFAQVS